MQPKTKILYVITKGNWGGAQRYVFDLATSLPPAQYIPVVAHGSGTELKEKLRKAGIRTLRIGGLSESRKPAPQFSDSASFFALWRILNQEKPDIVHLNSSRAALLGALAAWVYNLLRIKDKGLKIIFTVHGWPFKEPRFILANAGIWLASYITALLSQSVIVLSEADLQSGKRMPGVGSKRIWKGCA